LPFSEINQPFCSVYVILQWSADTALSLICTSRFRDRPIVK
jgi:hypothetical protein